MDNNPVMERVTMLTEMWRENVVANPEVRVFRWMGTSSVDYRMIRGFVMFHTSEKSKLDDVFFSLNQPFEHSDEAGYGARIVADMHGFLEAWNKDDDMTAKTGKINWNGSDRVNSIADEAYFIQNINRLADALAVTGKYDVLAVALLPQTVSDYGSMAAWIAQVMEAGISDKVRFMIFDTYEMNAFDKLEENYIGLFMSLRPDMDMLGAMNQILESAKAQKKDPGEKDAISFQQALLKMNEAISYGHEQTISLYSRECIQLAVKNNWLHLEALTYFFLHSYYLSKSDSQQGHLLIDKAIQCMDTALEKKIVETPALKFQYRISKGNLFFMEKKFGKAAEIYAECLSFDRNGIDTFVLLGIYQMYGNSLRHSISGSKAWNAFEEGWQLLTDVETDALKNNAIVMFYARDMMRTGNGRDGNWDAYYQHMTSLWGKDWMQRINRNEYDPRIA